MKQCLCIATALMAGWLVAGSASAGVFTDDFDSYPTGTTDPGNFTDATTNSNGGSSSFMIVDNYGSAGDHQYEGVATAAISQNSWATGNITTSAPFASVPGSDWPCPPTSTSMRSRAGREAPTPSSAWGPSGASRI